MSQGSGKSPSTPRNPSAEQRFEQGYATTPVRMNLDGRSYSIPMNFLTPFGNAPAGSTPKYLNVFLFLPDYRGYDKGNFRDPFDTRRIVVFVGSDFKSMAADKRLESLQRHAGVESTPSGEQHGLTLYRGANEHESWLLGKRQAGQPILLQCSRGTAAKGVVHPICETRYTNAEGGYGIAYRFHAEHLERWREIDDRINALVRSWETK